MKGNTVTVKNKYPWVKAISLILILGVTGFLVNNCGGRGGNGGGGSTQTGMFKDAVIGSLGYSTAPGGLSSKTNGKGEFQYKAGDVITFFIGDIELGAGLAKHLMTLPDLVPGSDDIQNPEVVNIARLLQSLDTEQESNIIKIPEGIEDVVNSWLISLAGEAFGFDPVDYDFDLLAQDLLVCLEAQMAVYCSGLKLVDEEDVLNHRTGILLSDNGGCYGGG